MLFRSVGVSELSLTASDSDAGVPTHTADLSSVFASTFTDSPGADGASGSTSYALQITATPPQEGGWVDSGLLATAGGSPLHIYLQNVGGVVVGTTSTQALTAPAEGHSWSENSTVSIAAARKMSMPNWNSNPLARLDASVFHWEWIA